MRATQDEFRVPMSSSPIASFSNITTENSRKTEYLADVPSSVARQLARELEKESSNRLIETVENKKVSIFDASLVV